MPFHLTLPIPASIPSSKTVFLHLHRKDQHSTETQSEKLRFEFSVHACEK